MKEEEIIVSYKGFDANWQCRGYQYELGKTYTHEGTVEACSSGFHACENPLDVFAYYAPGESKFAIVEQSGKISRQGNDTKIASASITIKAEIGLPQIIENAVKFFMAMVQASDDATATTGNWANAATTGEGANAATTGYKANAATTGYKANAATTGEGAVAAALGMESIAKAGIGGAIVLVCRNAQGLILNIRASKVGENGIKADTWYSLNECNEFIEIEE